MRVNALEKGSRGRTVDATAKYLYTRLDDPSLRGSCGVVVYLQLTKISMDIPTCHGLMCWKLLAPHVQRTPTIGGEQSQKFKHMRVRPSYR